MSNNIVQFNEEIIKGNLSLARFCPVLLDLFYGKIDSVIGGTRFPKKSRLVLPPISWYHLTQCVQKKERFKMSTTSIPVCHTRLELHRQEDAVFNSIPGMDMLRSASPESIPELEVQYPDAAFALMIAGNLFVGDREQNEIHQKAYTAILNGESITGVRFKYGYDL